MKFHQAHAGEAGETIEMTAMVDVVFILLSFFILATQFRLHEADVAMGYEKAALAAGGTKADFPTAVPVVLRNTPEGVAITVGQARLGTNDFDAIRKKLTEINMPSIPVTALADPSLSVDQVARALDAVLGSPMKKVSVSRLEAAPRDTR
jgi:biopolymer transport protein ExbD